MAKGRKPRRGKGPGHPVADPKGATSEPDRNDVPEVVGGFTPCGIGGGADPDCSLDVESEDEGADGDKPDVPPEPDAGSPDRDESFPSQGVY